MNCPHRMILIGHRGAGKTTNGQALGKAIGVPFRDLDAEIERAASCAVAQLFAREGEPAFREREWAAFQVPIAERQPAVIALGGGFTVERLRDIVGREDVVIWLRRPSDGMPRPFDRRPRLHPHLSEAEEWDQLYRARTPRYTAAATLVWDIAEGEAPEAAAQRFLYANPRLAPAFQVSAAELFQWSGDLPASKSELQRALILAAQAEHPITITGTSRCDDIRILIGALHQLGVSIVEHDRTLRVTPPPGGLASQGADEITMNVGASGAILRFLIPLLAKARGTFTLRGTARLHERPLASLLDGVRRLGGHVECLAREGYAPVRITGSGFGATNAGPIPLDVSESSQFASALLLSAIGLPHGLRLGFGGARRSRPYLAMTADLLRQCGIDATESVVPPDARISTAQIHVEADASSAAHLLAFGALAGEITIANYPWTYRQADRTFLSHLRLLGADVREQGDRVTVAPGRLSHFEVNCGDCPDLAPILAVLATFAHGTSRITGAPHLRFKESDRIGDVAGELAKAGVHVQALDDGLVVHGSPSPRPSPRHEEGILLDPHDDHRLAMSLPLLAFHGPPVTIANPGVVTKSFPEFWLTLAAAGCAIAPIPYAR